jgi:hypothetical protein
VQSSGGDRSRLCRAENVTPIKACTRLELLKPLEQIGVSTVDRRAGVDG